jgi:hypothetical protein
MCCKLIDGQLAIVFKTGFIQMPLIKKQNVDIENLEYIGFQNTRRFDDRVPENQTVGYFIHDKKFAPICKRPWNYVNWLKQYKQTFTLDVSCYLDMTRDEQWYGVYLNRLIGAFWQSQGLTVIPTVSWGDETTFSFCFEGIERGSIVAISTIGTKENYHDFMHGFKNMCSRIQPDKVICYCRPYPSMYEYAEIIFVEHEATKVKREAKNIQMPGQLSLFDEVIEYKEVG